MANTKWKHIGSNEDTVYTDPATKFNLQKAQYNKSLRDTLKLHKMEYSKPKRIKEVEDED